MGWRHFTVEMPLYYGPHKPDTVHVEVNEEADLIRFRAHRNREVLEGQFSKALSIYGQRLLMQKAEEMRAKPKRRVFAKRGVLS